MEQFNVTLAGVGGQGVLLAAEVLGSSALIEGMNVRVSEIHGMAQRGGAVVSHVRIGDKALSPAILEGAADVIVGFEPMEALRNIKFASQKTTVLVNVRPIRISGVRYPDVEEILNRIRSFTSNLISIDAARLAEKTGTPITQNIVMIGALMATGRLPMKVDSLMVALRELVPGKYLDTNRKAFELGYDAVKTHTNGFT